MTYRPYSLGVTQVMAQYADTEEPIELQALADDMTRNVQRLTGRTDVNVWLSPDLEWLIIFPGDIALEGWEADLIEGIMTPEQYTSQQDRVTH